MAVAGRLAGEAVAAALNSNQQVALASEGHRVHHIGRAAGAHHQGRVLVDHRVEHFPGHLVAFLTGQQQLASEAVGQFLHRGLLQGDLGTCAGYRVYIAADFGHGGQCSADGQGRSDRSGDG
jgi:hypothetical protein